MLKAYDALVMVPEAQPQTLVYHNMVKREFPIEDIPSLYTQYYASGQGNLRAFGRVSHVMIPDCQPGDEIIATGNFEVTTTLGWMEFCACLVLTPDASGVCGFNNMASNSVSTTEEPATGRRMTAFPGYNVDSVMHHGMFPMTGMIKVPEGWSGDLYVAIISYVSSNPGIGLNIPVEPFCGHLQAVHNRYSN
jgi:hypothetical protein